MTTITDLCFNIISKILKFASPNVKTYHQYKLVCKAFYRAVMFGHTDFIYFMKGEIPIHFPPHYKISYEGISSDERIFELAIGKDKFTEQHRLPPNLRNLILSDTTPITKNLISCIGDAINLRKFRYTTRFCGNNLLIFVAKSGGVEFVDLSCTIVDEEGIGIIANISSLKILKLRYSCIKSLHKPFLGALEELDIAYNELRPDSFGIIADIHTLKILNINNCGADDKGISKFKYHPSLTKLAATNNEIGAVGEKVLAELPNLRILDLSHNHLNDEGATMFAKNEGILHLNIDNNFIGDEGVGGFEDNKTLLKLSVRGNNIGDLGAASLARNTNLVQLYMYNNRVGDSGARSLANNTTLRELSLPHNMIGKIGTALLMESKTLESLNLGGNLVSWGECMKLSKGSTIKDFDC